MPLNRITGEKLAGFSTPPVLMPLEKWQDTKFWEFAAKDADYKFGLAATKKKSFRRRVRAAVKPLMWGPHEVLIQLYPYEAPMPRVVFLFCKEQNGKELYHWMTFDLDRRTVNQLRMAGRWPAKIEVAA